ncbi:hypothetical protein PS467_41505 [Streptomyces luomodiensis]|uniref:Uncharacterized protein n=1 Tax=Streptomyces luomodiensis TaxID=3026192 RepID=A0ABY9VAT6_9ACTN|nr:hypothetical protein [Streptomyces sp. SCA4-21]WNF01348.1 hypothetical protein PS467_41505 [Streptomyces sp. SCA4-21]
MAEPASLEAGLAGAKALLVLLSGDLHAAGASPADTGPEVITPHHQAEAIAAALGSPVRFHDLTCDEAKGAMAQSMLAEFAEDTLDILGFPSPRNAKSTWSPPRCSSSGQCSWPSAFASSSTTAPAACGPNSCHFSMPYGRCAARKAP